MKNSLLAFISFVSFISVVSGQGNLPIVPGMGAFTCFSGVEPDPDRPRDPAVNGSTNLCQDSTGIVLAIGDFRDPVAGGAPFAGDLWDSPCGPNLYSDPSWTSDNLGEIFGITITEDVIPDIFVSSSSLMGHCPFGSLQPGIGGNGGDIYNIDGNTGNITKIASLPNSIYEREYPDGTITSAYVGLGQIDYNINDDILYVSNLDNGNVYVLSTSGTILDIYDHGLLQTPSLPDDPNTLFSHIDRMVFALGYNEFDRKLYYGLSNRSNGNDEIWSVDTDVNGLIIDNSQIKIFERPTVFVISRIFAIPSDISFSKDGNRLLVSNMSLNMSTSTSTIISPPGINVWEGLGLSFENTGTVTKWAHTSDVYELIGGSGNWSFNNRYMVGSNKLSFAFGGTNSAGGSDYGYNNYGELNLEEPECGENAIVMMADFLEFRGDGQLNPLPDTVAYGLQISPLDLPFTSTVTNSGVEYPAGTYSVDLDCDLTQQDKFGFGDIEILGAPCLECAIVQDDVIGICNNNDTPNDSSDDFVEFSLNPSGTVLGTGYTISTTLGTLTPGSTTYSGSTDFTYTPSANWGTTITLTIQDNQTQDCNLDLSLTLPNPCSQDCPTENCFGTTVTKN